MMIRDKIRCFAEMFHCDVELHPKSLSRSDLMKSNIFLDSMPNEFSFSVSGPNHDNLSVIYEQFLSFLRSLSDNSVFSELETCLFPLFCHIYMDLSKRALIQEDDQAASIVDQFVSKYLKTVPERYQLNANEFVSNQDKFHHYAPLFWSQKFIVSVKRSTAQIFNQFLNRPPNSQLRSIITSIIVLEEKDGPQPHSSHIIKFSRDDPFANLNILKAEVKCANLAAGSTRMTSLFFVRHENNVYRLDLSEGSQNNIYTHSDAITTISASSSSSVVFSGDIKGNAKLWSIDKTMVTLPQSTTSIWSSDFAPSGGFFAFGSEDKIIRLFDTPNYRPIRYLVGHTAAVTDVIFHHNCFLVGSCANDCSIRVWDSREAKTVRLFITSKTEATLLNTINNINNNSNNSNNTNNRKAESKKRKKKEKKKVKKKRTVKEISANKDSNRYRCDRFYRPSCDRAIAPSFSWDGKMIAFFDKDLVVGDLATSKEMIRKELKDVTQKDVISINFSTNSKYVYIVKRDGKIAAVELAKPEDDDVPILNLYSTPIASKMCFSNDLFVVTSNKD